MSSLMPIRRRASLTLAVTGAVLASLAGGVIAPAMAAPVDGITAVPGTVSTGAILVASGAEPTALPWNPAPISVWAEPASGNAARSGSDRASRLVA